jgi:signal transduction histidine kinase
VAWLVASAAFVLARPWWDRRGRAPIRARLVVPATAVALAVPDAALILLRHSLPLTRNADLRRGEAFALTSPLHWFLGVAVLGLLLLAVWRELRAGGDVRSSHPWLSAAWVVAAAGQLVLLAQPISYRPLIVPADALPPITAALALIAFLAPQRAEASRARRASDRAQEVMGGRAEIAAMIAHEVRGPVATIRGLAGTALAHYDRLSDADRREFLDLIEQESRRLLATVSQASTALKVDAATLLYDMRAQDLARVIRVGVEAAEIGEHPLTVDVQEGLEATVDYRWFAEVVRQLVDNAARFSPPEGSIHVTAGADEGVVTIEIADEGPGIPVERRGEVFEKYVSWRPAGFERAGGSGLGLFLVRGIVMAHAGEVHVSETALGGTMLRVRIPREGEWQTDRIASPS